MDWSALIQATLHMYKKVAFETWQKIQRAWWVALLPLLYGVVFFVVALFASPLGIVGGFILGFALAICTGSYLYFISEVVGGNRVRPHEIADSWRPYFGSVISILFFLFILRTVLSFLVVPSQSSQAVLYIINLVLLIILNPIPEIIYQGRSDGFAMLQESLDFLWENGIEWFLPLLGLALISVLILPLPILTAPLEIGRLSIPTLIGGSLLSGSPLALISAALSALILYVIMVFRGLLFRELSGSSRRQRIYRSRLE